MPARADWRRCSPTRRLFGRSSSCGALTLRSMPKCMGSHTSTTRPTPRGRTFETGCGTTCSPPFRSSIPDFRSSCSRSRSAPLSGAHGWPKLPTKSTCERERRGRFALRGPTCGDMMLNLFARSADDRGEGECSDGSSRNPPSSRVYNEGCDRRLDSALRRGRSPNVSRSLAASQMGLAACGSNTRVETSAASATERRAAEAYVTSAVADPRLSGRSVKRIAFDEETIAARVAELGAEITAAYPDGELLVLGLLKGSFIFLSDLVREITRPLQVDFLVAASYGDAMVSSGTVRLLYDPETRLEGKQILLVEDIVDSGRTLNKLMALLEERSPRSLGICALLHKRIADELHYETRFVGFDAPNEFLVGYGLDHAENFRHLPYIASLQ